MPPRVLASGPKPCGGNYTNTHYIRQVYIVISSYGNRTKRFKFKNGNVANVLYVCTCHSSAFLVNICTCWLDANKRRDLN